MPYLKFRRVDGRSLRPTFHTDTNRPVVAGVYRAHRCGLELSPSPADETLVRRRLHGSWRRNKGAPSAFSPWLCRSEVLLARFSLSASDALRLASALLRLRPAGTAWAVFWFIWYRNTPAEKYGVTRSELDEIGAAAIGHGHGLPWGIAARSGNFCAILLMALTYGDGSYFFVAWLHTYLVRARNFSERDLLFSTLPFIFGGCANVASGITGDFLLKCSGLTAARRRVGIIGLASGGIFALLAAFASSKVATFCCSA